MYPTITGWSSLGLTQYERCFNGFNRTDSPRTLCMVSASISVQHVRCFSMVFLICAYVRFCLFLEFRGSKIKIPKSETEVG